MEKFTRDFTKEYLNETKKSLDSIEGYLIDKIEKVVPILTKARQNGSTVFIMGNGGSASTASHFACDLSKLTITDNLPRFKAISLTDNIPTILAWANDNSYEDIFLEQLKNLMSLEDIVIGISGSGNSKNVIKAVEYANKNGGITIGFSGYDGGKLAKCAYENINTHIYNMQRTEDMHLLLTHLITSLIKEEYNQDKK